MTKNPVKYTTVWPLLSTMSLLKILLCIPRKVDPTDHLHVKLVCKDLQQPCHRHRHNNPPHLRRSSQSNATPPSRTSFPRSRAFLVCCCCCDPLRPRQRHATRFFSDPQATKTKGQPHVQSPAVILRLKVLEQLPPLRRPRDPGSTGYDLPKSDVRCMPDGGSSRPSCCVWASGTSYCERCLEFRLWFVKRAPPP